MRRAHSQSRRPFQRRKHDERASLLLPRVALRNPFLPKSGASASGMLAVCIETRCPYAWNRQAEEDRHRREEADKAPGGSSPSRFNHIPI